ncbi:hypothetical protein BH11BAC4_BH11BAC4_02640 [soil metagenome]
MLIKKIKNITIVTIITYLLIELVCFIFIKVKFKAAHFPQFSYQYNYNRYDFTIAELDPVWGTWHYKETYTEKKQCFEAAYHINSVGARDKERIRNADINRIIFLGDSFIEGYGLNEPERLTDQLEKITKKEVLNFGCGYFTPTQEYLLYKNLAAGFSHNTIVIGILPFNDLMEDDTSFHEKDRFIHYQPYFQRNDSGYQLLYREGQLSKSTFNKQGYFALQNTTKQRTNRFLKEFSFWYNIYQFIKTNKPVVNSVEKPFSGYYDYTEPQLDKLKFILGKLKEAAPGKRVIIVTIPVYNDFLRYKETGGVSISAEIGRYCIGNKMEYIDLLPAFAERTKDPSILYFTCDGHWNATANKMAAEIILPLLGK